MRPFSKDILKDGMIVETRDKCTGIYIKGHIFFTGDVYAVDDYDSDGTCFNICPSNDIMAIYDLPEDFKEKDIRNIDDLILFPENLNVVWKRISYNRTFNPTQYVTVSPVRVKEGYLGVRENEECLEIKKSGRLHGSYNYIEFTKEEVYCLVDALNQWIEDMENLKST